MKLLFLHDHRLDSGKANVIQVLHMCRAFSLLGQDVVLAVPAPKGSSPQELAEHAGAQIEQPINFHILPYRKFTIGGRFTMIGGYLGALRLLKRVGADICMTRNPTYVNAALSCGVPVMYEAHNSALHDLGRLNRIFSRQLLNNARSDSFFGFTAISRNLADFWIQAGVPKDKVLALHDGVDVENYKRPSDVSLLRKRLGLPLERKIVAYTGSFYPDREIENILELARKESEAFFVLVGGPDANAAYFVRQAEDQGIDNIVFPGRVNHARVKEYLFAADVLLMVWSKKVRTMDYCSPLKVFEYMAAGRTIVGHGFPTIREVLTHGRNALLADPDSFDDLRAELGRAIHMPRDNELAQAARKLAFDHYSWRHRAGEILSYLKGKGLI